MAPILTDADEDVSQELSLNPMNSVYRAAAEMLPQSPAAMGALGFAAGIGVGALLVHVLNSRVRPDPMLERLGGHALNELKRFGTTQFANLMANMPKGR
jgi:hypothetical protein